MKFARTGFWVICCLVVGFTGCKSVETRTKDYSAYLLGKIEERDSLYIMHTLKEWGKADWWSWGVRSDMYNISSGQIEYFIAGTFYSKDHTKILVWAGCKKPNATTITKYNSNPKGNKICPNAGDTIYSLTALIGFRDSVGQTWKLYPFDNEQAVCFDNKESAIAVLCKYYFEQMRTHKMYRMMQGGEMKGHRVLQPYGYNLNEFDFFEKCWLFQKDTVGSNGLYPFQIFGYDCDADSYKDIVETYPDQKANETNVEYMARHGRIVHTPLRQKPQDCASPFKPPVIVYPNEILRLYQ